MEIKSATDLIVYKKACQLAMQIFKTSKRFPLEERYALTSQIRRSSRSICLNLREAWAKRRYEAHFISKLTDCDGEANETESSLDFFRDCQYMSIKEHEELASLCKEIGSMLACIIHENYIFIHKYFKANGFEISTRPSADGLAQG